MAHHTNKNFISNTLNMILAVFCVVKYVALTFSQFCDEIIDSMVIFARSIRRFFNRLF